MRRGLREGTNMQVHGGWKVAGLVALGAGAAAVLSACTGKQDTSGPMGELSATLMQQLKPSWRSGGLNVATDGVRQVQGDDGAVSGSYDGTRLLQAADAHTYGAPLIGTPAVDVQGDGTATFNEVRQVVRHFDADASGAFDLDETRAFESQVGIRWLPN